MERKSRSRNGRNRPKGRNNKRNGRPRTNRRDNGTGALAYPGVSQSNQNTGLSIRSMPLFGQRTRRVIQYADNFISITSGAGTAGGYVFSANGAYDPNITGTGHQPMGFDQMMLFYNHYVVTRSRIRVQFAATTTAQPNVALAVSGSSTLLTTSTQILEVGRCSTLWATGSNVANSHGSLQASCNLRLFQGVNNVVDDPDMRGDSASNPAEQVYYIIYVWNPIDSTVTSASVQVFIEYDTVFQEPRTATQS